MGDGLVAGNSNCSMDRASGTDDGSGRRHELLIVNAAMVREQATKIGHGRRSPDFYNYLYSTYLYIFCGQLPVTLAASNLKLVFQEAQESRGWAIEHLLLSIVLVPNGSVTFVSWTPARKKVKSSHSCLVG